MLRDSSTCFRPSMSLALVSACGIPTSEPLWSGPNVSVQCAPQSLATVPLTCRRSLRVQGWCQIARGTRWSHSVWRKRATWESTQSRIRHWAEWKCCCRRGVFWTWAGWCPLCSQAKGWRASWCWSTWPWRWWHRSLRIGRVSLSWFFTFWLNLDGWC